jgi:hypothetical protein
VLTLIPRRSLKYFFHLLDLIAGQIPVRRDLTNIRPDLHDHLEGHPLLFQVIDKRISHSFSVVVQMYYRTVMAFWISSTLTSSLPSRY